MNTRVIVSVACLFSLSMPGFTQQPAPQPEAKKHSIGLNVKLISSGGQSTTKTGLATKTQSTSSAPSYSVELRNFAQTDDNVTVEWYVFSKPVGKGSVAPHLYENGKVALPVPAGKTTTTTFEPKPMVRENRETATATFAGSDIVTSTTSSTSGEKLFGWMVRVMADDKVIAKKASEPSLEAMADNPPTKAVVKPPRPKNPRKR